MDRVFQSFGEFTHFMEKLATMQDVPFVAAAKASSHVLKDHVRRTFGDESKLAPLADATKAERSRLGYSEDQPLLRTGELLRDSVERFHEGLVAAVGSSEPVMLYHEFGYYDARAGHGVPPRPVFEIAMHESEAEIEAFLELAVGAALGNKTAELTVLDGITAIVP